MSIAALEPIYQQLADDKTSGDSKAKDDLGMDQFLTMLVAQLKHQDPLNPMEGTDFTAQLAQFSGLEQQFTMNDHLEDIQGALDAQENGNVLDYIGKTVKTNGNGIFVNDGQANSGAYTLGEAADVNVYIFDQRGVEVRRMHMGRQESGQHVLDWDGNNNRGESVSDGVYTFEIEPVSEAGGMVSHSTHVLGEVDGITYEQNMPFLMIGESRVAPSEVVEVQKAVDDG